MAENTLVVLETMPEQWRASHIAAGNWGTYPANCADRVVIARDEAEELVDDEYDHIVRAATPEDLLQYSIVGAAAEPVEIRWEPEYAASYVACVYGAQGDDPGDCYLRVGLSGTGLWWVDDGDNAVRVETYGPFASRELAIAHAEELAIEMDESALGEDAEAMQTRVLTATAGEPDPNGEYCVYWHTVGNDSHVVDRYTSYEAAEAAAVLAQNELVSRYPGDLLCSYKVRVLVDGTWQELENDD